MLAPERQFGFRPLGTSAPVELKNYFLDPDLLEQGLSVGGFQELGGSASSVDRRFQVVSIREESVGIGQSRFSAAVGDDGSSVERDHDGGFGGETEVF